MTLQLAEGMAKAKQPANQLACQSTAACQSTFSSNASHILNLASKHTNSEIHTQQHAGNTIQDVLCAAVQPVCQSSTLLRACCSTTRSTAWAAAST
jgi:hypothetical protein